jgi:hypothetical protein
MGGMPKWGGEGHSYDPCPDLSGFFSEGGTISFSG